MSSIETDLNDFNQFVKHKMDSGSKTPNLDELYDDWRIQNPRTDDLNAIKASLEDFDAGERGRKFEDFSNEITAKHKLD